LALDGFFGAIEQGSDLGHFEADKHSQQNDLGFLRILLFKVLQTFIDKQTLFIGLGDRYVNALEWNPFLSLFP